MLESELLPLIAVPISLLPKVFSDSVFHGLVIQLILGQESARRCRVEVILLPLQLVLQGQLLQGGQDVFGSHPGFRRRPGSLHLVNVQDLLALLIMEKAF